MKSPTVSIVIPTFNRAHIVRRAIDSALLQTHPCEVVLVDHGSTDATTELAATYGDRIKYIRREEDGGPAACWLDGAKQATGEYLHFTYDDDWIQPDFIKKCIAAFDSDVGLVYSRVSLRDAQGERKTDIVRHPPGRHPSERLIQFLLNAPLTVSPGCAVFRRADVLKNLMDGIPGAEGKYGVRSGVGEDLLLFLLTCQDYAYYVHVAEPLADFLEHPGSITINALGSGQTNALVQAYGVAKSYYLTCDKDRVQQGWISGLLFRLKWRLDSLFTR
jgi:glycosyltransferase involved in cell wall biosynthesis